MKINHLLIALGISAMAVASCNNPSQNNKGDNNSENTEKVVYEATLQPLNAEVTGGQTDGKARFVIANDTMHVTINVDNAPPGIEHWQHFHGFENGNDATCATGNEDANGDGIVDVVETETVSGTTMVPFNSLPAEMEVGSDTYPKADANGSYLYEASIPMENLKSAFADAFGGELDLDKRVLYIHGVPTDTDLAESVASIADIPAQVTLPIACGKIHKVEE